jgi:predicted metal-dependent phosphoesterase TrpH
VKPHGAGSRAPCYRSGVIDLHVHTTCSDGTLTPTEVVAEAAGLGLSAVAITDHDTVDGLAEALAAGQRYGIEVVPGVEINLEHGQITLDLLGYFLLDDSLAELNVSLAELRAYRDERNARILERLGELGLPVSPAELAQIAGGGAVGRPHIGEAMRRRGYVTSISDAFEHYLRRGAPAFVDRRRLTLAESVRLLRRAGGLAAIAHPGIIRADEAGLAAIVSEAAALGVAGLECWHPDHDAGTVARCLGLAREYDLVPTGGSDYHGTIKPVAQLGRGSAGAPIGDEVLAALKTRAARATAG